MLFGVGFVLENWVVMGWVFNEFFVKVVVYCLVGFFCWFRDYLVELCGESDSCVFILIFGLFNEIYFEYVYIVCYFGFMLLEGEDLMVENGVLMVCMVVGLKLVSVFWWCMDVSWIDLLEFNEIF